MTRDRPHYSDVHHRRPPPQQPFDRYDGRGGVEGDLDERLSKRLSRVLRHKAAEYNLNLSPQGFARLDVVCRKIGRSEPDVRDVVAKSWNHGEARFEIQDDADGHACIRATGKHTMDGIGDRASAGPGRYRAEVPERTARERSETPPPPDLPPPDLPIPYPPPPPPPPAAETAGPAVSSSPIAGEPSSACGAQGGYPASAPEAPSGGGGASCGAGCADARPSAATCAASSQAGEKENEGEPAADVFSCMGAEELRLMVRRQAGELERLKESLSARDVLIRDLQTRLQALEAKDTAGARTVREDKSTSCSSTSNAAQAASSNVQPPRGAGDGFDPLRPDDAAAGAAVTGRIKDKFDAKGYGPEYLSADAGSQVRVLSRADEDEDWVYVQLLDASGSAAAISAGWLPRSFVDPRPPLLRA